MPVASRAHDNVEKSCLPASKEYRLHQCCTIRQSRHVRLAVAPTRSSDESDRIVSDVHSAGGIIRTAVHAMRVIVVHITGEAGEAGPVRNYDTCDGHGDVTLCTRASTPASCETM